MNFAICKRDKLIHIVLHFLLILFLVLYYFATVECICPLSVSSYVCFSTEWTSTCISNILVHLRIIHQQIYHEQTIFFCTSQNNYFNFVHSFICLSNRLSFSLRNVVCLKYNFYAKKKFFFPNKKSFKKVGKFRNILFWFYLFRNY